MLLDTGHQGQERMRIESFYEKDTGTWTYLLADPGEGVAAVIDPVWEFDPVSGQAGEGFIRQALDAAVAMDCRIEWILETHAHADHLSAANWLKQQTGARIACGRGIQDVQRTFAPVFNLPPPTATGGPFDRLLDEDDELQLGSLTIRVMDTPGHTGDSITYLVGDAAFIGDTLFSPAFGTARCDFPGGDAGQLYDSIRKLYRLPRETRLFLCHDYPEAGGEPVRDITVEESMQSNIHLSAETSREDFVAMRTQRDGQLGLPRLILPSLQVNILGGAAPPADCNGISYLRIPFNRSFKDLIEGEPK